MRIIIAGVLLASLAGCASEAGDDTSESADALTSSTRTISPNHLVDDALVKGGAGIKVAAIQSVLDDGGGYLSTYRTGGKTAAQIISAEATEAGIHPAYLLARLQGESGLVTGGSTKSLAHATGCACPDGASCSSSASGFQSQVRCTAQAMKDYFDDLASSGKTISGWGVGVTKRTLDRCSVKPDNAATAAIYSYNPWVGSRGIGCGVSTNLGSSGIAVFTKKYAAQLAE